MSKTRKRKSKPTFVELAGPVGLTEQHLADCDEPQDADGVRLYAVARLEGVIHHGDEAGDQYDACRILYLSPNGRYAAEREFYNAVNDFRGIPRAIDVEPDDPAVQAQLGEPSEDVIERFGDNVSLHYEVQQ